MTNDKLIIKKCCKERFEVVKTAITKLMDEDKETIIIGIDGKCASGKTTLGYYLKDIFNCSLFHMDDFFLQDYQRTEKRLIEVGGNVDYERFKEEVLDNIIYKKDVNYRIFNCANRKTKNGVIIPYKRLNIIEGSYCLHPYFGQPYDLKIFMDINNEDQIENIRKRNGEEKLIRFKEEWIPKENSYFDKFNIKEGCINILW